MLRVWQQLRLRWPTLALLLVPRHPERFDGVAALAGQFSRHVQRRTDPQPAGRNTEIYIGDTMSYNFV